MPDRRTLPGVCVAAALLLGTIVSVSGCPSAGPTAGPRQGEAKPHGPGNAAEGGYAAAKTFDPVKENGPIFVDWPKPQFTLLITGGQYGYIEPCGCAGLENQKGGLSRRHSLIERLKAEFGSGVVNA